MKFKNMKFIVRDEEHSRQIQEALFTVGYNWFSKHCVQYLDSRYLFTNTFGLIQQGNSDTGFEKDISKLSTLTDISNLVIGEESTINIGGNLYLVSDVENALKNLKKIEE